MVGEGRPVLGFWGGSKVERRSHVASVSMVLIVTPPRWDRGGSAPPIVVGTGPVGDQPALAKRNCGKRLTPIGRSSGARIAHAFTTRYSGT